MGEIVFLGTGCMQPTKTRNHAGVLLKFKTETLLFDCGEGIQRQMRIAGEKPAKITRLLISHFHGDHVFGIPGLMSSMGADQFAKKLHVYGPTGTKKYLGHLFKSFAAKDIIEHEIHEINKGKILETDEFMVEAHPLRHSVPCIGFKFIEKNRRKVDIVKAKKLGLKGEILGKLQKGSSVTLNGKKIKPDDVTYVVKGKTVSYVTDTAPCTGANKLAEDTDILILEGTLLDDLKKNAAKSKHLTVKQAALIASENNTDKLVITHISQRYKNNHEILEEAHKYFRNSDVAEDFMKIKF
jgi:ribonuclease Z